MGMFTKYLCYSISVSCYRDAMDVQDELVRALNDTYNLDLLNPFKFQGDGYISFCYDSGSLKRRTSPVRAYVTDLNALIVLEEGLLSDSQVETVIDETIEYFTKEGLRLNYDYTSKPISDSKVFSLMRSLAGLYY